LRGRRDAEKHLPGNRIEYAPGNQPPLPLGTPPVDHEAHRAPTHSARANPMAQNLPIRSAPWLAEQTIQVLKPNKVPSSAKPASSCASSSKPTLAQYGTKAGFGAWSGPRKAHPLISVPCRPAHRDSNVIPSPTQAGSSPSRGQLFEAKNQANCTYRCTKGGSFRSQARSLLT
jgi:hypothetical protein